VTRVRDQVVTVVGRFGGGGVLASLVIAAALYSTAFFLYDSQVVREHGDYVIASRDGTLRLHRLYYVPSDGVVGFAGVIFRPLLDWKHDVQDRGIVDRDDVAWIMLGLAKVEAVNRGVEAQWHSIMMIKESGCFFVYFSDGSNYALGERATIPLKGLLPRGRTI